MISFANDPNELNTVIRLWPDGPPSSLPCVGPEITFGSPAVFGPETIARPSCTSSPAAATGFGVGKRGLPVDRWTDLLVDRLADQGFA
ncbi:hypothetical protein [Edaphobacter modestus]|jgi:hypothetical protein|uniref:Uncharacterized protein n=1 Tax=Edaphobacter modestus TaxID=388466 RepID=A0A4Q7Z0F1_9BACT|nr:hypothetical protein [Edaphobacter modestus]RZU43578.1 hypothetical protein BDD14_5252 [Edaphobacter modestus]